MNMFEILAMEQSFIAKIGKGKFGDITGNDAHRVRAPTRRSRYVRVGGRRTGDYKRKGNG